MKTESDVRDRIVSLLSAEFDRRVFHLSKRLPTSCVHNYRHPLDNRKLVDGEPNSEYNRVQLRVVGADPSPGTLGLCMVGAENHEDWQGNICEDPIDAQRCPIFTPLRTNVTLLNEFQHDVADPDWVSVNMPELAALVWVLESSKPVGLPWWKLLWYRIRGVKLEPRNREYLRAEMVRIGLR